MVRAEGSSAERWQVWDSPGSLDAGAWNELLAASGSPTPFMRHEYLLALQDSGSATAETGWQPVFLTLHRHGRLEAACPLYLKAHSYGEYVFDWAWADAHERHGLAYYPKLLNAVPFTPVPGGRLLARQDGDRRLLLRGLRSWAQQQRLSSAHLLFLADADAEAAADEGWMMRQTVQFHWQNRADRPYADFTELLAQFQRDKRKKIQQERRRVVDAGVSFRAYQGGEIDDALWDFFYRCYTETYRQHRSNPYLTRRFFSQVSRSLPDTWLMFVAERAGQRIAASLIALDPDRRVAHGRYWGALDAVPCLHFEACYYQPLAWCIAQGYRRFEGGAQGEHKMARGLLPVTTRSAHWLREPAFADAVQAFLDREGAGMADYVSELRDHDPFKRPA